MDKAVYPGSFDPITLGHLDIIERASNFTNELVVGVGNNPSKDTLFTVEERVVMIEEATAHLDNIQIKVFAGLLVEFMHQEGISLVIRGLRAMSDFEAEFQMALMNKKLAEDIETIMMVTRGKYNFLSSSLVKEVAMLGGCIEGLVPEHVARQLAEKFSR